MCVCVCEIKINLLLEVGHQFFLLNQTDKDTSLSKERKAQVLSCWKRKFFFFFFNESSMVTHLTVIMDTSLTGWGRGKCGAMKEQDLCKALV